MFKIEICFLLGKFQKILCIKYVISFFVNYTLYDHFNQVHLKMKLAKSEKKTINPKKKIKQTLLLQELEYTKASDETTSEGEQNKDMYKNVEALSGLCCSFRNGVLYSIHTTKAKIHIGQITDTKCSIFFYTKFVCTSQCSFFNSFLFFECKKTKRLTDSAIPRCSMHSPYIVKYFKNYNIIFCIFFFVNIHESYITFLLLMAPVQHAACVFTIAWTLTCALRLICSNILQYAQSSYRSSQESTLAGTRRLKECAICVKTSLHCGKFHMTVTMRNSSLRPRVCKGYQGEIQSNCKLKNKDVFLNHPIDQRYFNIAPKQFILQNASSFFAIFRSTMF
ncbi:hypothetical protein RFI_00200 [Reticulomyxa filosa]|uniref:Uncharacterized protein n=1 Tax=Reticulomyxa filosa TaxID=46433 RepID=X6PED3_RETFI|nr:hypothetical protein RFI_00200 [Reticulomyxa filosa]|eukprot:ETO36860.1 hypothetical protein RFI_00200 [Reticulomyxa filosa]